MPLCRRAFIRFANNEGDVHRKVQTSVFPSVTDMSIETRVHPILQRSQQDKKERKKKEEEEEEKRKNKKNKKIEAALI